MLRGYRRVILAALGCLILCGAKPPTEQGDGGKRARSTAPAPQNPATPSPTPSATQAAQFSPYSGYNPDPCYHAKDHDAADLCAQWRASIAAEKAAHEARRSTLWSIIATFLSAATVVGLIVTIWQTYGALGEARRGNVLAMRENARSTRRAVAGAAETAKALRYAKENAKAAAAQVEVFQKASLNEIRAYVTVNFRGQWGGGIDGSDLPLFQKITLANYGKTPAKDVSWRRMIDVLAYPPPADLPDIPRKYLPKRQSYGHWRGSIRVEQKLKERSLPMNLESLFKATERREYIFSGK